MALKKKGKQVLDLGEERDYVILGKYRDESFVKGRKISVQSLLNAKKRHTIKSFGKL